MIRKMSTVALRVGVCAVRVGLHVTEQAVGVALGITRRAIGGAEPGQSHRPAGDGGEPASTQGVDVVIASVPWIAEAAPGPAPSEALPGPVSAPPIAADVTPARDAPPAHVSEELRFVEAFAEPGAEEGAGATVHVEEPWKGYAQMTGNDVITRLSSATREELAAVAMYEGVHRRRKTVPAARRQLRWLTAAASATQADRP
jgi:hypothetical protein